MGIFDVIAFFEAHSLYSVIAVVIVLWWGKYITKDVTRWFRGEKTKRANIDQVLAVCKSNQETLVFLSEAVTKQCDIEKCNGLSNIREELISQRASMDQKLSDIKSLMVDVAHEHKNFLIHLIGLERSRKDRYGVTREKD